ncbi:Protein of unknown function [Gryllus bimaculatus]|nr:Protein of unknown function [Gryllus bimaculatus]
MARARLTPCSSWQESVDFARSEERDGPVWAVIGRRLRRRRMRSGVVGGSAGQSWQSGEGLLLSDVVGVSCGAVYHYAVRRGFRAFASRARSAWFASGVAAELACSGGLVFISAWALVN